MASVDLETVLMGPVDDLAASVALEVDALADTLDVLGELRVYAGGRTRIVRRAARLRSVPVSFDVVRDRPLVELVRSWAGRLVLLRDPYGRVVYGTYLRVEVAERIPVDVVAVRLEVSAVSWEEGA